MKFKLQAFDIWQDGQRKDSNGDPHQEDSLFPEHMKSTPEDRLFLVCDGMGGHDAGEVASKTVCEAMSKYILSSETDPEGDFSDETLVRALEEAFCALNLKDTGAARKMGTTMTLLKFHSKGCTIAHIGDSRVYHIRPGKTKEDTQIMFVTEDHSLVNELVKFGEITKEEAMTHPKKNVITRAMQPNMERYPKVDVYHTSDILPDDYFYLCTDGMLEHMTDGQLCFYFIKGGLTDKEKIDKLIHATGTNKDNHTAIMVHVLDVINPIEADAVDRKTTSLPINPRCNYHDDDEITLPPELKPDPSKQGETDEVIPEKQSEKQSENSSGESDSSETKKEEGEEVDDLEAASSSQALTLSSEVVQKSKKGGNKNIFGAIIGIVVVLGICYFLMQQCSDGVVTTPAEVSETEQPKNAAGEEENTPAPQMQDEVNEQNQSVEDPELREQSILEDQPIITDSPDEVVPEPLTSEESPESLTSEEHQEDTTGN